MGLLCCLGCENVSAKAGTSQDTPVAASFPTDVDVRTELSKMPPVLRERFDSQSGQNELERALVDRELLVAEARRRGLANQPALRERVRTFEERLIVQALVRQEQEQAKVEEADIADWYEAHRKEYSTPEQVRVARFLVLVRAGDRPRNRRQQALALRQRLVSGATREEVAQQTDGPERARDGDLGFRTRGQFVDRGLAEAAFGLEVPGQVSEVLEHDGGYAFLQLLDRRPARLAPLEEVRGQITNQLSAKAQRETFERLVRSLREQHRALALRDAGEGEK